MGAKKDWVDRLGGQPQEEVKAFLETQRQVMARRAAFLEAESNCRPFSGSATQQWIYHSSGWGHLLQQDKGT